MDLFTTLIILHLVGTILGVGAATFIEIHLNAALKDGKMSPEERVTMGMDFFVSRVGLAIAFLSGLGFIYLYWQSNQLFRMENGIFWGKMTIILILILNAYLLHKHKIGLYWGSALSLVSWWAAALLGIFLTNSVKFFPQNFVLSFLSVLAIYGLIVVVGAYILHRLRGGDKSQAHKDNTPSKGKEPFVQTADEALGRVPTKQP